MQTVTIYINVTLLFELAKLWPYFAALWITFWSTCSWKHVLDIKSSCWAQKHSDSDYFIHPENWQFCPVKTQLNYTFSGFQRACCLDWWSTKHSTQSGNCQVHSGTTFIPLVSCFWNIDTQYWHNNIQTSRLCQTSFSIIQLP